MKKAVWLLIGLAFSAGAPVSFADHGWVFFGYELHWRRDHKGPVNIDLVDTTGSTSTFDWYPYSRLAAKDWKEAETINTNWNVRKSPVRRVHPDAGETACVAKEECIEVQAANFGPTGWLGLGGGWIEYDVEADEFHWSFGVAIMNDFYYDTPPYSDFYGTPEWRQLVMCQEIGHALGLGHNDENFFNEPTGTCMDYSIDPLPNQHPDAHDLEVIDAFHDHVHPFVPRKGPKPNIPPGLVEGDFGEMINSSAHGATFVRHLGGNSYWVTHVTYAQEM